MFWQVSFDNLGSEITHPYLLKCIAEATGETFDYFRLKLKHPSKAYLYCSDKQEAEKLLAKL
jgi:hypothetical protein